MDYSQMTGLVLDGGGGKGAYQIGVLKTLMENNLLDDVGAVSGVSIGAVNAVLYALGNTELMKKVWDDINIDIVFDFEKSLITENGLYFSRDEMIKLIDKYVDFEAISKSELELYAGVCAIENEQYVPEYMKLNEKSPEEIKQILMASTALPIIYEPIVIGEKMYRDGGIKDNEPIKPLYDLGIRKFIVIGLNAAKVFTPGPFKDAEFITIYPSHDLGDLISGTLNFDQKAKDFRIMLGEKDAKRAIKTKFEKQEIYINLEKELALNDYNEILSSMRVANAYNSLSSSVNSNIDKFNAIASKYDI